MPKAKILPTTQRNVQPCDQEPEFSPIQQAHRPMILGSQPAMHNVPTWLVCPQQLKTAGAFWGHTKTGKVNNTEKYIWGSLKILYYDNATGSKTFTKCGWISPKEEFGESHSSLLSCQMTIFFHCMKQMKEFQEKKLNMRRPERTDTQLNLNMNVKAWKNAEIITIIWSRRKQSQMKKKEEELYYDTATLNLKETFVTVL